MSNFALVDETGRVCELFDRDPRVPPPEKVIVVDEKGVERDLTPVYIDWPLPQRIVDVSGVSGIAENWTVDKAGKFSPPPSPEPSTASIKVSFLEFMDLFTDTEQLAIAGAAMTDVATKLWYDRAVGAQFIDLGDERLAAGLQKMVDGKLLTAARRSRVLKGLPPIRE